MAATVTHLPVQPGPAAPAPFIPGVARALAEAGFPADLIPWLHLDEAVAEDLSQAMNALQVRPGAP